VSYPQITGLIFRFQIAIFEELFLTEPTPKSHDLAH